MNIQHTHKLAFKAEFCCRRPGKIPSLRPRKIINSESDMIRKIENGGRKQNGSGNPPRDLNNFLIIFKSRFQWLKSFFFCKINMNYPKKEF